MKRIFNLIANVFLLSIVAIVLAGCGKTGQVSVRLSEINNYPVIGIPNPYGPAITFAPVNADKLLFSMLAPVVSTIKNYNFPMLKSKRYEKNDWPVMSGIAYHFCLSANTAYGNL